MRLLDLFCGAGGAAMGYYRTGFEEIVGIDTAYQKNYPFHFVQADALEFLHARGGDFDAIHASPPCQAYSSLGNLSRERRRETGKEYPDLIAATRTALERTTLPWIIENVVGAPLINAIQLCGSSFGLDLRRHRLFESNVRLSPLQCNHSWQTPRFRNTDTRSAGRKSSVTSVHGHQKYAGELALWKKAMGIHWMTAREISQAIPPAYTEYIGAQILAAIQLEESA